MRRTTRALTTLLTAAAALGLSACTSYGDYGYGPDYGAGSGYRYGAGYGAGAGYGPDDGDRGERRYGDYAYHGDDYDREDWREDYGRWDEEDRDYFRFPVADRLDPWLVHTEEGRRIVRLGFDSDDDGRLREDTTFRANAWFRRYADTDRDMRLTDEEIRLGLVQASRDHDRRG